MLSFEYIKEITMADKAILFGINDYAKISDLRGCLNDLASVRELLTQTCQFDDRNIRTYENKQVVWSAIEEGFDWLAKGSGVGDRLVFHFSGHGSYITSESSDKDVDELICLYDMDWDNDDTFVRDVDLGKLTQKVSSGARLTIVLDSCHSGTGTRALTANLQMARTISSRSPLMIISDTAHQLAKRDGAIADHVDRLGHGVAGTMRMLKRNETPPVYARFVEPPTTIRKSQLESGGDVPRGVLRIRALGESMRSELNHQLLAAAKETETAADAYIGGDYHGAFSFYLCDAAKEHSVDSYDAVMRETRVRIKREGYGQNPRIEGPFATERLFGGEASDATAGDDNASATSTHEPIPSGESTAISSSTCPPCAVAGSDADQIAIEPLATLNHLLRVSEKLIDLAGYESVASVGLTASESGRGRQDDVIVYVHGISEHPPGYSQGWHESIVPHLSHPIPREEVRWSQHVNRRDGTVSATTTVKMVAFRRSVEAELEQRMQRIDTLAEQRNVTTSEPDVLKDRSLTRMERPRSFLLDDFTRYMFVEETRELILGEFTRIVEPLLEKGRTVHIVSHSWGTVVAYEGMRQLDNRTFAGHVANLFVAGSALSIGAVRSNLFGRVENGRAPVNVSRFINLDAGGDVIGGPIGDSFTVDREYLGLDPTGCRKIPFTGIAVNPVCAHGAYFRLGNIAVNRDVFATFIRLT